jgi:hypothetical protein
VGRCTRYRVAAVTLAHGPRSHLNVSATLVVFMSGEVVGAANGLLVPSYDGYNEGATCCSESPDWPSPHPGGSSR